jgi:F-type H+-transporting ATPase subunit epsilon
MAKTIELKIVTPQKTVYQGTVEHFTAPGVLGPFQVLFNHAAIVSKLQPGLLKFVETTGNEEHYYVSGGFLELHENAGTVLADSAEHSTDINIADAEAQIENLRQRYADHEAGFTNEQFHIELNAAQARLKVAKS